MRVLGIDPGSHVTGYGLVDHEKGGLKVVAYGEIRPARGARLTACLKAIHERLQEIVAEHRPDALAVEDIFYGKNVKSLIRQGHVRGVTLLTGALAGVAVYAYSPLEVKQAVVGYGRAEKPQVQRMVMAILGLVDVPPEDAADALAVAICHAHTRKHPPA